MKNCLILFKREKDYFDTKIANDILDLFAGVNFPINCDAGAEKISAYKKAADDAGLLIAEVGIWKNTLDADLSERKKWIDYSVGQLQMADDIGAICAVNVVGTPYGPRWDGGYKDNFSSECWDMAIKMIQQIIDTAKPKKAKFSIESMPWMIPSSPDEYVKMIKPKYYKRKS